MSKNVCVTFPCIGCNKDNDNILNMPNETVFQKRDFYFP